MATNKHADKGKWAEKQVADILAKLNAQHIDFAYDRLPDARAARGALKAQLCDFTACYRNQFFMIEVKETKHPYRLPRDKISQVAVMRKWEKAGAQGIVIVFHSTTNYWRVFYLGCLEGTPPSWDLREHAEYSQLETALREQTNLPL